MAVPAAALGRAAFDTQGDARARGGRAERCGRAALACGRRAGACARRGAARRRGARRGYAGGQAAAGAAIRRRGPRGDAAAARTAEHHVRRVAGRAVQARGEQRHGQRARRVVPARVEFCAEPAEPARARGVAAQACALAAARACDAREPRAGRGRAPGGAERPDPAACRGQAAAGRARGRGPAVRPDGHRGQLHPVLLELQARGPWPPAERGHVHHRRRAGPVAAGAGGAGAPPRELLHGDLRAGRVRLGARVRHGDARALRRDPRQAQGAWRSAAPGTDGRNTRSS